MTKISINLLPPEVIARELKNAKFYKIQFAGVAVVLFMIFLTSLTLALQVLQNRNIALYQARVTQAEEQVTGLKDTQAELFLLKNRITTISQYFGVSSKQTLIYQLINKLIPSTVVINSVTIDKNGEAAFLALVPDFASLDNLINNLTTSDQNEDRIKQVSIESLNRGRDGVYRVSFKIKPS